MNKVSTPKKEEEKIINTKKNNLPKPIDIESLDKKATTTKSDKKANTTKFYKNKYYYVLINHNI